MSKASEFVIKKREAELELNRLRKLKLEFPGGLKTAYVENDGNLYFDPEFWCSPERALELAAWIIDTFGEPEQSAEEAIKASPAVFSEDYGEK